MSVSDEIKQRIDIVEFVSRYTPLRRTGSTYTGLCPFHNERTPSFIVFPHSGTWHCFGACSTGGDLFSFVMKKENLDFREALELLAQQAGVSLDRGDAETHNRRDRIYAANDKAAGYFQEILRTHPGAQPARDYLARRGIDHDTAERFRLGFALDGWNGLRDYLSAAGFEIDLQLEAGLVKRNEERDSIYDAFRGRVMIPIRDRQGRVIGFGGRVLDDSHPKYLNTSETPVFHKSHVIYGLDMAHRAIRDQEQVVIVEGYMDVIAAHQHGFANVVACMGTALTAEQLRQLQRLTTRFVLALDADSAGQQATIRGLNQARQSLGRVQKPAFGAGGTLRIEERLGADLFIASMPEGRDPDDVVRHSPDQWRELIAAAKPLADFYFDIVARQVDLTSARGKGSAVAELAPLIAELDDEIERQHYIQKLSRLVQIDEMTIVGRVQAAVKTGQAAAQPRSPGAAPGRYGIARRPRAPLPPEGIPDVDFGLLPNVPPAAASAHRNAATAQRRPFDQEDYLLASLLAEPDLFVWLSSTASDRHIEPPTPEDWQHVENQEIFRGLKRFITSDEQWDPELFQEALTPHLHWRLEYLVGANEQRPRLNPVELRDDMLKVLVRIRLQRLRGDNLHIKYLIDDAQRQGDKEAARSYDAISNRNLRELAHLQRTLVELSRVLAVQGRADQGVKIR